MLKIYQNVKEVFFLICKKKHIISQTYSIVLRFVQKQFEQTNIISHKIIFRKQKDKLLFVLKSYKKIYF